MYKKLITLIISLLPISGALAVDKYDYVKNELHIENVLVGKRMYQNVYVIVDEVLEVKSGAPNNEYDVYTAENNVLNISSVMVGSVLYTNVKITVGAVLSIGGFINTGKMGAVSSIPLTKQIWDKYWKTIDPISLLSDNGLNYYKVQYTTKRSDVLAKTPVQDWERLQWSNDFMWSEELSIEVMKRAQAAGMRVIANPFFSDVPQHAGSHNNPEIWKDYTLEQTAIALKKYAYESTIVIVNNGIKVDHYQLNCESDLGILDFSLGRNVAYPANNFWREYEYMREKIWKPNSILYKAAIEGIKMADPQAKFSIQAVSLGASIDNKFLKEFFKTLLDAGVQLDYLGMSYPYHSGDFGGEKFLQTEVPYFEQKEYVDTIKYLGLFGKPLIISEFGYPKASGGLGRGGAFKGQNDNGFPFTASGQSAWIGRFINSCNLHQEIRSCLYFYPEYFPGISYGSATDLESAGIFLSDGVPAPSLYMFKN